MNVNESKTLLAPARLAELLDDHDFSELLSNIISGYVNNPFV